VGVHTSGCLTQWIEAVENAHESGIPDDLMVEWGTWGAYRFCWGDGKVQKRITTTEHLMAVTPMIEIGDRILRYSWEDLAKRAIEQCPLWWVNCSELPERLKQIERMQNYSGWGKEII
jgi:hypothetical protein